MYVQLHASNIMQHVFLILYTSAFVAHLHEMAVFDAWLRMQELQETPQRPAPKKKSKPKRSPVKAWLQNHERHGWSGKVHSDIHHYFDMGCMRLPWNRGPVLSSIWSNKSSACVSRKWHQSVVTGENHENMIWKWWKGDTQRSQALAERFCWSLRAVPRAAEPGPRHHNEVSGVKVHRQGIGPRVFLVSKPWFMSFLSWLYTRHSFLQESSCSKRYHETTQQTILTFPFGRGFCC